MSTMKTQLVRRQTFKTRDHARRQRVWREPSCGTVAAETTLSPLPSA